MKLMNDKYGSSLTASRRARSKLGSSLILVLLVIAGILTVVFGAQRVTLVQFSQSNREEDNVSAYYAARAGIEDGLLRYRFTRDTETAAGKVYRYGLTTGSFVGEVNISDPIDGSDSYSPNNQYYDLSMNFKSDQINMNTNKTPNFAISPVLQKDGFLELTGFSSGEPTYYLRSAFKFFNPNTDLPCNTSAAFVQIERRSESGAITQFRANKPTGDTYDSYQLVENIQADTADSFRIRPYHCDVKYAFNTSKSNSTSGSGAQAGPLFDSLTARITTVGYFGSAKRTLMATVDRNTGRLLDIYDFNALAGNNIQQ